MNSDGLLALSNSSNIALCDLIFTICAYISFFLFITFSILGFVQGIELLLTVQMIFFLHLMTNYYTRQLKTIQQLSINIGNLYYSLNQMMSVKIRSSFSSYLNYSELNSSIFIYVFAGTLVMLAVIYCTTHLYARISLKK